MSYNPNGPIKRKKESTKRKNLFLNSALNTATRPISLKDLEDLKVDGILPTKVFTENAGTIFPHVLERLSLGDSIPMIEIFLGMIPNSLRLIIQKHDRLKKACNEARKVKNDRVINPPQ